MADAKHTPNPTTIPWGELKAQQRRESIRAAIAKAAGSAS